MIGPPAHPAGDENGAALTLAWRRVIGPGFALPRDAGPHRENCPEVGVPSRPRHLPH